MDNAEKIVNDSSVQCQIVSIPLQLHILKIQKMIFVVHLIRNACRHCNIWSVCYSVIAFKENRTCDIHEFRK